MWRRRIPDAQLLFIFFIFFCRLARHETESGKGHCGLGLHKLKFAKAIYFFLSFFLFNVLVLVSVHEHPQINPLKK